MMRKVFMLTVLVPLVFGTLVEAMAMSANNAEFRTLKECLAGIQKNSGQTLRIVTDRPEEVSGFLANEQGFACEKQDSGTKGVYFKGWYMTDD